MTWSKCVFFVEGLTAEMGDVSIEPQSLAPPEATPSSRSSSGKRMQPINVQPDRRNSNKPPEFSDLVQGGFEWGKRGLIWSPPRLEEFVFLDVFILNRSSETV